MSDKKFKCYWCEYEFKADAWYDKDKLISAHIKCPKCGNFIRTWEREETGSSTGRKHTHKR